MFAKQPFPEQHSFLFALISCVKVYLMGVVWNNGEAGAPYREATVLNAVVLVLTSEPVLHVFPLLFPFSCHQPSNKSC